MGPRQNKPQFFIVFKKKLIFVSVVWYMYCPLTTENFTYEAEQVYSVTELFRLHITDRAEVRRFGRSGQSVQSYRDLL